MLPEEFYERLSTPTRENLSIGMVRGRASKKTLEEQPLTDVEKATIMAALTYPYDSPEEALECARQSDENIRKSRIMFVCSSKFLLLPCLNVSDCPPEGVECDTFEFDNIKVFYHIDNFLPEGGYTFYVGRSGCSPDQCIDWYSAGIRITLYGPTGQWGESRILVVPDGTRTRIHYTTADGRRRTKSIVFPIIPTHIKDTEFSLNTDLDPPNTVLYLPYSAARPRVLFDAH